MDCFTFLQRLHLHHNRLHLTFPTHAHRNRLSHGQQVFSARWQVWLTIISKSKEEKLWARLTVEYPGQVRKPAVAQPPMKVICSALTEQHWASAPYISNYWTTWKKTLVFRLDIHNLQSKGHEQNARFLVAGHILNPSKQNIWICWTLRPRNLLSNLFFFPHVL